MTSDSGTPLTELRVDGGMVRNNFLMQFQADILGVPVVRPVVAGTTARGAAYLAGLAVGYWQSEEGNRPQLVDGSRVHAPRRAAGHAGQLYRGWRRGGRRRALRWEQSEACAACAS